MLDRRTLKSFTTISRAYDALARERKHTSPLTWRLTWRWGSPEDNKGRGCKVVEAASLDGQLYSPFKRRRGRKAGSHRRRRLGAPQLAEGDSAHGSRSTLEALRESAEALVSTVKKETEKPARRLLARAEGSNISLLARGRRKLVRAEKFGLISSKTRDMAMRTPTFINEGVRRGDYSRAEIFTEIEAVARGVSQRQIASSLVPDPQSLSESQLEGLYNSPAALQLRRSRGDTRLGPSVSPGDLLEGGIGPHRPSSESLVRRRHANYLDWVRRGKPLYEE